MNHNFLLVIPVCAADIALMSRNLDWCKTLDGSYHYECLISYDKGLDITELREKCNGLFEKVHECVKIASPLREWPYPQNKCFQDTARHVKRHFPDVSFFWWEADCTPLKKGWLDSIRTAHEKGGRPFSGPIVKGPLGGHFNGVSVYPADVGKYSSIALLAHHWPWDVDMKKDVNIAKNVTDLDPLMQHVWMLNEQCPTFPDMETLDRVVHPDAVVFHRCKDGTTLDRLEEKRGGIVHKAKKLLPIIFKRKRIAVIGYLPPKGIGHTDVFLSNLADYPPSFPVHFITDGDWPDAEKIERPPVNKSDKIATHVFLESLKLAERLKLDQFIYVENDCRFGKENWDRDFVLGKEQIAAGALAICNPTKEHAAFSNASDLKDIQVLGQKCPGKEPVPFVNGAPAIYSVKLLRELFGSRPISEWVAFMDNQDRSIGQLVVAREGNGAFTRFRHLPIMATAGETVYRFRTRVEALANGTTVHPIKSRYKPKPKGGYTFYSSGDLGDILYSLKGIQLMGGGKLILGTENKCRFPCRSPITRPVFGLLFPLLKIQPYLTDVVFSEKEKKCDYNLNYFRDLWNVPKSNQPSTLVEIQAYYMGVFQLFNFDGWLTVPSPKTIAPVVVHRSARYHADFDWKKALSWFPRQDYVFVGLPEEHANFVKEFGPVAFYQPVDFLDMARVIQGSDMMICNQSFPGSIALALNKKVIQETYKTSPDCVFKRDNFFNQHKLPKELK